MGIAELITMAMEKEGLAKDESLRKIWMVDSKGLIVKVSYFSTAQFFETQNSFNLRILMSWGMSSPVISYFYRHEKFKNEVGF